MRGIGADALVTIKTNDGRITPGKSDNGRDVEALSPDSPELLRSVKEDKVDVFLSGHAGWAA
jgi:hypothetical protein